MKKTILVVEDFASIRKFVCQSLERKGYNTIGASNGKEAFATLIENAGEVDLVLTDYNMPDGSGFDLLKKIKSNPKVADVPVIFLTAAMSFENMKAATEAGLTAWIGNPYRSEIFFAEIESALSKTR
jgi:two-component system chemotaxis response regulator CheY